MNAALRALNRFGLGARTGEAARISSAPRDWLHAQLAGGRAPFPTAGLPTLEEAGRANQAQLQGQAAARDPEAARAARAEIARIRQSEAIALLRHRITTDTPFLERLTAFWSNHLCISTAGKQRLAVLAGLYERDAIRPHVLGRFSDMVLASARHPAMLNYLDNAQSIGPDSQGARTAGARQGRERGLNENYARELLELHTVGVDGGYTQTDVVELAKILTGWAVAGAGPGGGAAAGRGAEMGFVFRPALHQPGAKTVMGIRYREAGEQEGEQVIRDLCALPATARFISTKLVTHFVHDYPPPAAVDRVASVFLESEGNLREVALALVELDEAWDPLNIKFRTPQEWIVAALRAMGAREAPPLLVQSLAQLRHPLWAPASPKGFGDTTGEWADPDSLLNRAELARTLAQRVRGARIDPAQLLDVVELKEDDPLPTLLADNSIPASERMALAIGGPAFQWR
jgi:uncharacterized protein (DUF1800 family)